MIVLDASVLIAYLDDTDEHHPRATRLLTHAISDELGVNTLTLAEVLIAPIKAGRRRVVQAALNDLEIEELPFPPGSAARLGHLRAETGLKMPGCCVLLAAEESGGHIATFDERLGTAATDRGIELFPTTTP